jgi:glycosyltransferase involved in cell wall biosynthesis
LFISIVLVKDNQMRLLFVQYGGDYREAAERLVTGGGETYYAQKYSVDAVAEIGQRIEEVAVLCLLTDTPYNQVLQNGVRAIGAGFTKEINPKKIISLIEEQNPTHLIVCTPNRDVLQWAIQNKVKTIAVLADSFPSQGLRNKFRNYLLSSLLNNQQIHWVFNHGINSSLQLKQIGVKANKIIPWDWPARVSPEAFSPKALREDIRTWNLVYVGAVTETKGVGDVLEAIAMLKAKNLSVSLKIAGGGEIESLTNKAQQLQIEDSVKFLGLVPNNTIVPLMREADLVLIPSRHEYPEGFPITIYEALCSRTPLVASDHPMFKDNLKHGINSMIFPAANPIVLSECIEKLLSDPELYQNISVASAEAWKRLQIPVKWADMINRWLDNSPENQQWLFEHRLASERYDSRVA